MSLASDIAASEARVTKRKSPSVQSLRAELDSFEAAIAAARAETDAANAARAHAEAMQRAAEAQIATERQARQLAETQSAADQRARVEAEGVAARERARADALQSRVDEVKPQPMMHEPHPPTEPVAYTHEISRGTDGLIRSITSRPIDG